MKQAIVYGGAFNPPTTAHQEIVQQCILLAKEMTAEVWLMPSGDRLDKTIGLPTEKRLQLIDALCRSIDYRGVTLRIEQSEIKSNAHTQTFTTVEHLQSQNPEYNLKWVFGSDSIGTMKQWRNGLWLHDTLDMIVVERSGVALQTIPPKATIMKYDGPMVSSTMVREHIKKGTSYANLVPPQVYDVLSR